MAEEEEKLERLIAKSTELYYDPDERRRAAKKLGEKVRKLLEQLPG